MTKSIILFEITPKKAGLKDQFAHVEKVLPHVVRAPGFISAESFTSLVQEEKYCFLCVFESDESARQCRDATEQISEQNGRQENLFENYTITVGSVVRQYTHEDRNNAPQDSNDFLVF